MFKIKLYKDKQYIQHVQDDNGRDVEFRNYLEADTFGREVKAANSNVNRYVMEKVSVVSVAIRKFTL